MWLFRYVLRNTVLLSETDRSGCLSACMVERLSIGDNDDDRPPGKCDLTSRVCAQRMEGLKSLMLAK